MNFSRMFIILFSEFQIDTLKRRLDSIDIEMHV